MEDTEKSLAKTKTKSQSTGEVASLTMGDKGYVYFEPASGNYYVLDNETANAVERENDRIQALLENQLKSIKDFSVVKEQCLKEPKNKVLLNHYNTLEQNVYQANKKLTEGLNFLEPLKPEDDNKTLILSEISSGAEKLAELLPIRKSTGKVIYARSSLNHEGWKPYTPEQSTSGHKSFIKNGKVDTAELHKQLHDISGKIKKEWDIVDPKEHSGTLSKWAENWNKAAKTAIHEEGKESPDDNFDASAGAQLLRYSSGLGASVDFDPKEVAIQAKLSGSAEFALWEGKTEAKYMYPDREGWFPAVPARHGGFCQTGLFRLDFTVCASASVGASISMELSATFGGKPDDPQSVGVRGAAAPDTPPTRDQSKKIDLTKMAAHTQSSAGFRAFAGVESKAEISGAIMWKEPEMVLSKDPDDYKCIAKIAVENSYLFGVGVDAVFKIEINNGRFYISCHAMLCMGEGAGGGVSYEVDGKLIIDFIKYALYLIRDADFQKLSAIIGDKVYREISAASFMLVSQGTDFVRDLSAKVSSFETVASKYIDDKDMRLRFISEICEDEQLCQYTTPEVKGHMLAVLTEEDSIDAVIDYIKDNKLDIKKGVMNIVRWTQSKAEYENVMQHCSLTLGQKKYSEWRTVHIRIAAMMYGGEIFTIQGQYIGDGNGNEYGEIFEEVYPSLSNTPMAGYPLLANDSHDYILAKNDINNGYFQATALA